MLARNVLYYGREEPVPEQIPLRAGPLSLIYERGDLRYIRLGEREILRRVYVAVRDRNWGTVPPLLSNVSIESQEDSFYITYDVEHRQGDIDFCWRGEITGDAQGTIRFSMQGRARSTFLRNRIGFCVLHPISECTGQPCTVEQANGSFIEGKFPQYIAPEAPFQEMQSITHQVMPGLKAEVRFTGDIFEMEDQRNWIDASYKTFCTPLRLPYPVEIKAGTTVYQTVTLKLHGAPTPQQTTPVSEPLTLTIISSPGSKLPQLGLGMATHGQPLTAIELERLRMLHLSHLRVDLHLSQSGYVATLRRAAKEAQALGVELEVALFLTNAAREELEDLLVPLQELHPPIKSWLIFHVAEKSTGERWVTLARDILATYDRTAKFGTGTNVYFTELNRGRPPVQATDFITYSVNPQVHAFDNASLVETLEALPVTVASARSFSNGLPIRLSPVTFKMRFNPDATGAERVLAPGELPAPVDVRQMSLLGAGWTLGSLKQLAVGDVESVTYYETTGWRGVMESAQGSPLPEVFRSLPNSVFPLYHVLLDVGEFSGGQVLPTVSSDSLKIEGMALRKDGRLRILLCNFTPEPQEVMLSNMRNQASVRSLDETNAEDAIQSPEAFHADPGETIEPEAGNLTVRLLPYGLARIDMDMKGA